MNRVNKILLVSLLMISLFGCNNKQEDTVNSDVQNETIASEENYQNYIKVKQYCDRVFVTDVYKDLDIDEAITRFNNQYDKYVTGGGCTSIGKRNTDDGLIIGRNMDLYITNKPSYIVKTNIPGLKKTFGLMYSNSRGDDIEFVKAHGVEPEFYNSIPYFQTDIMNEDGFYIEINMRNADYDINGNSVFSCSGTLPNQGKTRIDAFMLPVYLGTRCSTVEDAIKLATEELDIFTPHPSSGLDWNFGFMIADATGKYGVLEIAENKVVFNEAIEDNNKEMPLGAAQANYYVTPEFYEKQRMKSGVGRIDYLKELWPSINNEEDMFSAISDVSYFQCYFPYCKYDNLSEFVGIYEEDGELFLGKKTPDVVDGEYVVWDYDYISNPMNQKYVKAYIKWTEERINVRRADNTFYDIGAFWESTFTLVANPEKKSMFIRFNENNKNIMKINFEEENWD